MGWFSILIWVPLIVVPGNVGGGDGHGDQVLGLEKKKEKNKKLKTNVKLDRSFLVW
jgi:hypothetical protein